MLSHCAVNRSCLWHINESLDMYPDKVNMALVNNETVCRYQIYNNICRYHSKFVNDIVNPSFCNGNGDHITASVPLFSLDVFK